MHVPFDARLSSNGAAAYLNCAETGGGRLSRLVFDKPRVVPLMVVPITRLALAAALSAMQIAKRLKRFSGAINGGAVFWRDYSIILKYIHRLNTRFNTFVVKKLTLILESTEVNRWFYAESTCNLVAYCSPGLKTLDKLSTSTGGS